jgi:hypothetical protein
MAEFAKQAKQMLDGADVYMRVVDFKLTKVQPPRAYATVIQLRLPTDHKTWETRSGAPAAHQPDDCCGSMIDSTVLTRSVTKDI